MSRVSSFINRKVNSLMIKPVCRQKGRSGTGKRTKKENGRLFSTKSPRRDRKANQKINLEIVFNNTCVKIY
jgi:hypothetical protein